MDITFSDINTYDERTRQLRQDIGANCGRPYRQCSMSVMDTIADPDISFDSDGVCNYYKFYLQEVGKHIIQGDDGLKKWKQTVNQLKESGRRKKYDCIIGLSGGVDSTYLCLLAKEYGLRPLVIHCDNSWNSGQAYRNMERTINTLGFDFYTYLIHWQDFRELQLSYLRASVVDIEIITDHAFMAVLHQQSRKWGIRSTLVGTNLATEQVLPRSWAHYWTDVANMKDIYRVHGAKRSLTSFPILTDFQMMFGNRLQKMQFLSPLNWLDYQNKTVQEKLSRELGWEPYAEKHTESIWTRFFQLYILPEKFNIDKRKAHLSNLIFSGQMTKNEALDILKTPPYEPALLQEDMRYVLSKLDVTLAELKHIMALPVRRHQDFKIQKPLTTRYPLLKVARKMITRGK